jgi:hypothetical protein
MVSAVPYPHVINRYLKTASAPMLMVIALASGTLLFFLKGAAVSFAFWGYALSGMVISIVRFLGRRRPRARKEAS